MIYTLNSSSDTAPNTDNTKCAQTNRANIPRFFDSTNEPLLATLK